MAVCFVFFLFSPVSPVVEDEGVLEATHLEKGVGAERQSLVCIFKVVLLAKMISLK